MWTAEVTADHEGYRVLGSAPQGDFALPPAWPSTIPPPRCCVSTHHGYGTVYMVAKGYDLNQ